jgi:hypothetical protein
MPPTKLRDWSCESCSHVWEYLSHGETDTPEECPDCSSKDISPFISGTLTTRCHDPASKKEILKKRSADHTRRLVAKEAGHKGSLPPDFGRRRQT